MLLDNRYRYIYFLLHKESMSRRTRRQLFPSRASSSSLNVLVLDASVPESPDVHLVDMLDAPAFLRRALRKRKSFEQLVQDEGVEGTRGLVNPAHRDAERRTDQLWEYLQNNLTARNRGLGLIRLSERRISVDAYLSIYAV